eukprot:TRINITY_DN96398_c0_g1_i1.p1 TRINITY_DN96398_c0_g1~~TRINITY_DN96398_c0_g1_i1.p1  ORF type:complete len:492 (-),score=68.66 TRINITY_DN96398_c0_g1_i1:92-1567(-)
MAIKLAPPNSYGGEVAKLPLEFAAHLAAGNNVPSYRRSAPEHVPTTLGGLGPKYCTGGAPPCPETVALLVDSDMSYGGLAAVIMLAAAGAPMKLLTTVHGACATNQFGRAGSLARRLLSKLGLATVATEIGAEVPPETFVVRPDQDTRQWESWDKAANLLGLGPDAHKDIFNNEPSAHAAGAAMLWEAGNWGRVTILALGPLTNIVAAAAMNPAKFRAHVERVVIARDTEEHTPDYELDPSAWRSLLQTGVAIELIGSQCRPDESFVKTHFHLESEDEGRVPLQLLRVISEEHPSGLVREPVAAAYCLWPENFKVAPATVAHEGTSITLREGKYFMPMAFVELFLSVLSPELTATFREAHWVKLAAAQPPPPSRSSPVASRLQEANVRGPSPICRAPAARPRSWQHHDLTIRRMYAQKDFFEPKRHERKSPRSIVPVERVVAHMESPGSGRVPFWSPGLPPLIPKSAAPSPPVPGAHFQKLFHLAQHQDSQ